MDIHSASVTFFERAEHRRPLVVRGLEFTYGSGSFRGDGPFLLIAETTTRQPTNGWLRTLAPVVASSRELMLAAARALRPFSP